MKHTTTNPTREVTSYTPLITLLNEDGNLHRIIDATLTGTGETVNGHKASWVGVWNQVHHEWETIAWRPHITYVCGCAVSFTPNRSVYTHIMHDQQTPSSLWHIKNGNFTPAHASATLAASPLGTHYLNRLNVGYSQTDKLILEILNQLNTQANNPHRSNIEHTNNERPKVLAHLLKLTLEENIDYHLAQHMIAMAFKNINEIQDTLQTLR